MMQPLEDRCRRLLEELQLCAAGARLEVDPLTGGVASDIARVDCGSERYCVKFALPRLKVAADWQAPVHRNRAEYAWLEVASKVAPDSAIRLFGRSEAEFGFAMEYLEGGAVSLWKSELLSGEVVKGRAAAVGDVLGRIHRASTVDGFDSSAFHNCNDFQALRIEPYLYYTASRWPELASRLCTLGDALYEARQVLVHGDVSPKNILFRGERPVLLDAECATMGDAAFDVSFCLNHLVLKSVHMPARAPQMLAEAECLWSSYSRLCSWEPAGDLEKRICQLLPALMLARVDGKSPVEYLDENGQARMREIAIPFIRKPPERLAIFFEAVQSQLQEVQA